MLNVFQIFILESTPFSNLLLIYLKLSLQVWINFAAICLFIFNLLHYQN